MPCTACGGSQAGMIDCIIEKTGMRAVPALISFALFLLFVTPFFANIINLGNCVGAFLSGVLTAVFVFFGPFKKLISSMWGTRIGRVIISTAVIIAFICIILASVISAFMLRASRDAPNGRASTVVVLGCKVNGTSPSLMLERRLDAAYEFLSENPDTVAVVSGGKGDDEHISEAECMKNYLVENGISPDRIYIEDKSSSTYENLKFSQKVIEENGLNDNITIVTDSFHQLRAEMIAGELGFDAYNVSAHTPMWLLPTYWVREWFGVVYQFVFG